MPSKLRKALGAVKDQTSINLAKVSPTSNLEIAILKSTTHEEIPVEDRYINEILLLTSSNKIYATICAHALSKRITRTRNWIVALKCLMIVLRLFQDGDPYFFKDVHLIMKRGGRFLNLNTFRDDYNSSPWDYTAYVRTVALYLNERLQCFINGKLQRRTVRQERDRDRDQDQFRYHDNERYGEHVRDMKPGVLVEKIKGWQGLLAKAIATRPTGIAKNNRMVQISLYAIVRESFDVYRDISDGLRLILDSFFNLPEKICFIAFDSINKSLEQFDELNNFYKACKDIGVGRSSEYPTIEKISPQILETLQEFIKDQASFPEKPPPSPKLCLPPPIRQRVMSLEDLISSTEPGASPSPSFYFKRRTSSSVEDFQSVDTESMHTAGTSPARSIVDQQNNSFIDLLSFDDPIPEPETSSRDEWELVLVETANSISSTVQNENGQASSSCDQSNYNNPFLSIGNEISVTPQSFSVLPTFQAAPTFSVQNPNGMIENDIFSSPRSLGSLNQSYLSFEQQMWLQNQNQIIAKHRS